MEEPDRPLESARQLDSVLGAFKSACRNGECPSIREWLNQVPVEEQNTGLTELIRIEVSEQAQAGRILSVNDYLSRFPDRRQAVLAAFPRTPQAGLEPFTDDLERTVIGPTNHSKLTRDADTTGEQQPLQMSEEHPPPVMVGRYRIEQHLGKGAFGAVYRALDTELNRMVAVKLTRQKFITKSHREMFLTEARMVATLDHPHIVPVYDVGQTESGDFFVVSKLIDGSDLVAELKRRRFDIAESLRIVSSIATALHHAHQRGLVHRDVKPANILLDGSGDAYLADFGLALSDDELGRGSEYVGTPAYMSPEQIGGISHRLDGRSDIFSLGVVLYELLSGRRPFRSDGELELKQQVMSMEVKPLRQIDDKIPEALERICLKALAKNINDRYATAADFARELAEYDKAAEPALSADQHGATASRRFVLSSVAISAVAVLIGLVIWNPANRNNESTAGDSSAEVESPSPPATADPASLIQRFEILASRDHVNFHPVNEMAPLQTGDSVRFSLLLGQPSHVRLLWIDAAGEPVEVYPTDPEAGHRGDDPVMMLESPIELDRGWPLEGKGGIETALLLVNRDPLPNIQLEDLRAKIPATATLSSVSRFVATRTTSASAVETDGPTRSLGKSTRQVDNAVLQLLEKVRQHADIAEAVTIPHQ